MGAGCWGARGGGRGRGVSRAPRLRSFFRNTPGLEAGGIQGEHGDLRRTQIRIRIRIRIRTHCFGCGQTFRIRTDSGCGQTLALLACLLPDFSFSLFLFSLSSFSLSLSLSYIFFRPPLASCILAICRAIPKRNLHSAHRPSSARRSEISIVGQAPQAPQGRHACFSHQSTRKIHAWGALTTVRPSSGSTHVPRCSFPKYNRGAGRP